MSFFKYLFLTIEVYFQNIFSKDISIVWHVVGEQVRSQAILGSAAEVGGNGATDILAYTLLVAAQISCHALY